MNRWRNSSFITIIGQQLHHSQLVRRQVVQLPAIVGMYRHRRLAGQLERRRQRNGHHVAHITHVIIRYPFPETELVLVHNGVDVKYRQHILHRVSGAFLMHTPHHSRIQPLRSELHHYPLPRLNHIVILLWHTVGICTVNMKGQYDINKKCIHYRFAKIRKKTFSRYKETKKKSSLPTLHRLSTLRA